MFQDVAPVCLMLIDIYKLRRNMARSRVNDIYFQSMPRPVIPESERRTKLASVRFRLDEWKAVEGLAQAAGCAPLVFIRKRTLGERIKPKTSQKPHKQAMAGDGERV